MILERQILLVLENGVIDAAVVDYAVKLARRMDGALSLVMLVPRDMASGLWETALAEAGERVRRDGQGGCHEIRRGAQASELLKYIAVAPAIAAIIWGGDGDILTGRRRRKSEHWFEKVRPLITCPLVTPRTRAKKGK
ncbi:hypothetical protein JCM14469_28010 [Desulfatiferula olefinivorans]